jgi:hypothetical protein
MDDTRAYCFNHFGKAAAAGRVTLWLAAMGHRDMTPEEVADVRKRVALADRMMAFYA